MNLGHVVKLTFPSTGLKGCAVKSPADNKNMPKVPNKYRIHTRCDTTDRYISSECTLLVVIKNINNNRNHPILLLQNA